MTTRLLLPALLLCLPIAACTAPDSGKGKAPADQSAAAPATSALDSESIGKTVQEATDKARKEITQGNIAAGVGIEGVAVPDGFHIKAIHLTLITPIEVTISIIEHQAPTVVGHGGQPTVEGRGQALRGIAQVAQSILLPLHAPLDHLKGRPLRLAFPTKGGQLRLQAGNVLDLRVELGDFGAKVGVALLLGRYLALEPGEDQAHDQADKNSADNAHAESLRSWDRLY